MVYDCFLFFNELKMLNFRLHELNDVVDYFVIVESNTTFSGNKKPFYLEEYKNIYESFKHKIIYLKCNLPQELDPWSNEKNQRNFFSTFFKTSTHVQNNDIIMLSDIDEIPDTTQVYNFKNKTFSGLYTFYQNLYYYNYFTRCNKKWPGTVITNFLTVKNNFSFNFEKIRQDRCTSPYIGYENNFNEGGWHFSYFGDENFIINKIKNFSHQEYNKEKYTSPAIIKQLMQEGKDLFQRNFQTFTIVKDSSYLPKNIHLLD